MADTSIEVLSQTLAVSGVGSLVLTSIEQDPDTGLFVRELRSYGPAPTVGGSAPPILIARYTSDTAAALQIRTPELII